METEREKRRDLLLKIGLGIFYTGITIATIKLAVDLGKMARDYLNQTYSNSSKIETIINH